MIKASDFCSYFIMFFFLLSFLVFALIFLIPELIFVILALSIFPKWVRFLSTKPLSQEEK